MNSTRHRWGAALFVGACLVLWTGGVAAQEPLSWGTMQSEIRAREPTPSTRIEYGPGLNRFGELRVPFGPGPHPVAIVIHGGCWLSIADLSYMRPLATELGRLEWATWTLEFNRIDQGEGSWPGILDDVAAGADHLREIADEHGLDLGRVVAVGHSSGGHLALWLAARGSANEGAAHGRSEDAGPLAIHGVVGLAPVTGLEDFQARSDRCGSGIVDRLIGSSPGASRRGSPGDSVLYQNRLSATDPERMLPLGVDQLLVFGGEDRIVPPAHGGAWRRRGEAAGDTVAVEVIPGAGHFELVAPWTEHWTDVEVAIRGFLYGLKSGV